MNVSNNLTLNELKVLAVLLNHGKMYGLEVVNTIKKEDNSDFFLGSLYNVLSRLEKKGFVKYHWGDDTSERGGNRRKYYELTGIGARVTREAIYSLNLIAGTKPGFELKLNY